MRYGVNRLLPAGLNHQSGRFGESAVAVVVHMMLGRLWGTDSHFRDPNTGASTNFGIGWPNLTDERNDTRCQTWQWVDTNDTAWGWAAKPTKSPTDIARSVLNLITPDLNRQVIHIEMANYGPTPNDLADWYRQPFRDSQYAELQRVLEAIAGVHGNLALLGHSDCSTKLCPGVAIDWKRIGGGHGGPIIPEADMILFPSEVFPAGTTCLLEGGVTYSLYRPTQGATSDDLAIAESQDANVLRRTYVGDGLPRPALARMVVDGDTAHTGILIGSGWVISGWGPQPRITAPTVITQATLTQAVNVAKQQTADKANAQMDAWTAARPAIKP